ncbi:hypothetical protein AYO38_00365 [bacterium SCGC AG-212-C10]|nr:hypothetical protein AYO38_00365 [bacterium SCGC AG-212-C10]
MHIPALFGHLNAIWVLLYTAGLTDDQKAGRRAEIKSDVYEQIAYFAGAGRGSLSIGRGIASRMTRGIRSDILWRLEAGREAESVVREGGNPPLPWLTMVFLTLVLVGGSFAPVQPYWTSDAVMLLAIAAALGAGLFWLGLYLVSHHFFGPLFIAMGTIMIAWGLWWTLVVPVIAVVAGVSGVRRAQRLERLVETA